MTLYLMKAAGGTNVTDAEFTATASSAKMIFPNEEDIFK